MKLFPFLVIVLCLCACTKDETKLSDGALPFHPRPTPDFRVPREGLWEGCMHYNITGVVDQCIYAQRQIRYISDSTFTVKWWSTPDTCDTVIVADTMRYRMVYRSHNINCGDQLTLIAFDVAGYIRNDTLIETGTVNYSWFYNGVLRKYATGQLFAQSTWQRIIYY